jgi:hypothetical protein
VLISSLDVRPPLWAITDGDGKFSILLRRAPETTHEPISSPRKARVSRSTACVPRKIAAHKMRNGGP